MRKLRIHSRLPQGLSNAQFYYRQTLPLSTIQWTGLAHVSLATPKELQGPIPEWQAHTSDIYLIWQNIADVALSTINSLKDRPNQSKAQWTKATQGQWPWPLKPGPPDEIMPTSIVVDIDDDVFNIDPSNPAYQTVGTRLNGRPLTPGAIVWGVGRDGQKRKLWADGENGFDVRRNREALTIWRDMLRSAELVTVTTEALKQAVLDEVPKANVFVFPNCINIYDFPQWIRTAESNMVKVLIQGGSTHTVHIDEMRGEIERVIKRYPNVQFVVFGGIQPPWMHQLPYDQIKFIPWVDYTQYKTTLAAIGHDINVALLADTVFNRSRTGIKAYEAASLPKPAPTIAANVGPFKAEITDGDNGLLFDTPEEFEEKLCKLIEDATLRKDIAYRMRRWVLVNRDARIWTPKLVEAYQETRDRRLQNAKPVEPDPEPNVGPGPPGDRSDDGGHPPHSEGGVGNQSGA